MRDGIGADSGAARRGAGGGLTPADGTLRRRPRRALVCLKQYTYCSHVVDRARIRRRRALFSPGGSAVRAGRPALAAARRGRGATAACFLGATPSPWCADDSGLGSCGGQGRRSRSPVRPPRQSVRPRPADGPPLRCGGRPPQAPAGTLRRGGHTTDPYLGRYSLWVYPICILYVRRGRGATRATTRALLYIVSCNEKHTIYWKSPRRGPINQLILIMAYNND